jgi:hypothetical protein
MLKPPSAVRGSAWICHGVYIFDDCGAAARDHDLLVLAGRVCRARQDRSQQG